MREQVLMEVILVATVLWIGFVTAISFMEAWLKFRAPGVTLQIGLGIGQLVFRALNKAEIIFASVIALAGFWTPFLWNGPESVFYIVSVCVLLVQTFWLLPGLDKRIRAHLNNMPLPKSNLHLVYVVAEFIKAGSLTAAAVQVLMALNAI